MTEEELNHLNQWIEKAGHDLVAAKLIIDHNPLILDIACFHCQQGIEKYLKSLLIYKGQNFPRTHHLDFLLELCSRHSVSFEGIDFGNLDDFAVDHRYPTEALMPDADETSAYYEIALQVKSIVLNEIGENSVTIF